MTIRKLFHFLSLMLFIPPLFYLEQSDVRMQMMTFAFNCVTVLLMLVEYVRCQMPRESRLNTYFNEYCDEREEAESTLILSHIYLLVGCAMAPTITFILVNGGFVPQDFAVMSLCGIVFLGLGDSTAALYGKAFGASKWRSTHLKSQEGSTMCVIVCSTAFYLISYVQST
jgi:dolichol kinase